MARHAGQVVDKNRRGRGQLLVFFIWILSMKQCLFF
jgi:hypothetical protein